MIEKLEELKLLLDESRSTLIFTGAGISTLSGIPDFRSPSGCFSNRIQNIPVETVLSLDCFRARPELFYEWARMFVYGLEDYQPNIVHRVVAEMEARDMIDGVYTQNIDLLHTRAGSRKVFELHGSPAHHHCLQCRAEYDYGNIAPAVQRGNVPHCSGCGGVIKPDIVFYGENLDDEMLTRGYEEMKSADLVLVLGSSLTVYPAASLPEAAVRAGGKMVIVNTQPTPLDRYAALRFDDLGRVFESLADWMQILR